MSRRTFLGTIAAAAGVLTVVTVGETLRPFSRFGLLAPRNPSTGPQGFPVNRAAAGARVTELIQDPAYSVVIRGKVTKPLEFTIDELRKLPQHQATLPIACVDGWSASPHWEGVRVRVFT